MYIYKFTLNNTNRCYVGQTIQDPARRRLEHLSHSYRSEKTYHFHNALRKYGVENFTFEVIATTETIDELNQLEDKFINEFDSINNGFNIRTGGGNKTHRADSIERMREAQRSKHARRREENGGIETINKKSGYKFSKPHPKKGKESKKWSEEAKIRYSEVAKQRELKKRLAKGIEE